MKQFLYNITLFFDKTTEKRFYRNIYFLFFPIFYIIDFICYKYFWNIVKKEIFTSETIIEYLDKNEFGYKNNQIYKKDIIDNEFYLNMDDNELEFNLKREFIHSISKKFIEANIADIENFINIYINIDEKITKNNKFIKIYGVYIRYYRYEIIFSILNLIRFISYILTLILIFFSIKYFY